MGKNSSLIKSKKGEKEEIRLKGESEGKTKHKHKHNMFKSLMKFDVGGERVRGDLWRLRRGHQGLHQGGQGR